MAIKQINRDVTVATPRQGENFLVTVKITRPCETHQDGAVVVAEYIIDEMKRNAVSAIAKEINKLNKQAEYFFNQEVELPISVYTGVKNEPSPAAYTSKLMAYEKFYDQVNYNKPWDHKPLILRNADLVNKSLNKTGRYHKYRKADYYYDVWSNIHYGFIGLTCGFSEDELRYGAGVAQLMSDYSRHKRNKLTNSQIENDIFYEKLKERIKSVDAKKWDNPEDQNAIEIGFEIYKSYQKDPNTLTADNLLRILDKLPYGGEYKFKYRHTENCKNGYWVRPRN